MPPKKAATAPSRTSTRQKTVTDHYTPATSTTSNNKRKAESQPANEANTKRKRSAKSATAASTTSKTTTKSAPVTKKTSTSAPKKPATKTAAPKKAAPTKKTAAATSKAASKLKVQTAAPATSRKRKAEGETKEPAVKKRKTLPIINDVPTQILDVYTFGGGESGELGHGPKVKEVKRPRLNAALAAASAKIVAVAVGGMHTLALSADNKIWSWGVNDQGALGRNTDWDGGLRDMDGNGSDDDSEGAELNPNESTPAPIPDDAFPEGVVIASIAAGDSCSFAVTNEGLVYGWGTFRSNEGILGFTKDIFVQTTPMLMPDLKNITEITCGSNHAIALDKSGSIYCWGAGEQNQLGRRLTKLHLKNGLRPTQVAGKLNKKVRLIGTGSMHSFAITKDDKVFAWGLNQYGQFGCELPEVKNDSDIPIILPVASLSGKGLSLIKGGSHHSLGVDGEGRCLVWGRCDGAQTGLDLTNLPEEAIERDMVNKPAKLMVPTAIPELKCSFATTESDHAILITKDGKAYSWGFSANYQTGLGTDDDVELATHIDNTAVREKKLNWAGAGGQFSVLTAPAVVSQE